MTATDVNSGAEQQHSSIGIAATDGENRHQSRTAHPEAGWFPGAGLGLFLHWGLSSVSGDVDLSWGMIRDCPWDAGLLNTNKMKPAEYWKLAERFDPPHYDPGRWIAAAAEAGFRYAVLTTRHHEGYALWPSEYGDFSTRTHLGGRDLVQPYVDACRRHGLKVGFYYSPPDWHFNRRFHSFGYRRWPDEWIARWADRGVAPPAGASLDENWDEMDLPETPLEHETAFAEYVGGQIRELLTAYVKIDIIWFDGNPFTRVEIPIDVAEIRRLQPGIVINPRLHGTVDFETPECAFPTERPKGWWEGCFIWNYGGWGYCANEIYQPLSWFLDLLARHRSWGGNLLINCAPRPDGRMPDTYYRRMEELTAWMERHREAIVDAQPGPWPEQSSVPVTVRGSRWYLHLVGGKQAAATGMGEPRSARVLATGEPVEWRMGGGEKTLFVLKWHQCTDGDDVIAVDWQ